MKRLTPAKVTMIMFMVVGTLITAYIAKSLLAVDEKPRPVARRNVPMPISDLPAGTLVREEHLGMGPILETDLNRDMLLQNRVIVGRIAKEKLPAATAIRSNQLWEPGAIPPLAVDEDMRAVTITVSTPALVDGLIRPGEYVDVHFTVSNMNDPRLGNGMMLTLFHGVKILAINRLFMQGRLDRSGQNSVTLELTPEQAAILVLAKDRGTINFSSNPQGKGDGRIALKNKDRVTLDEILNLPPIETPEPPPAPTPPFVSQMYRGSNFSELQFRDKKLVNGNSVIPSPPQGVTPANPGVIPPDPDDLPHNPKPPSRSATRLPPGPAAPAPVVPGPTAQGQPKPDATRVGSHTGASV